MNTYIVEMVGNVREVYVVQAESEAEAREGWMDGALINSEASDMEFYSLRLDDDQ